jgi:hypothetical protein
MGIIQRLLCNNPQTKKLVDYWKWHMAEMRKMGGVGVVFVDKGLKIWDDLVSEWVEIPKNRRRVIFYAI